MIFAVRFLSTFPVLGLKLAIPSQTFMPYGPIFMRYLRVCLWPGSGGCGERDWAWNSVWGPSGGLGLPDLQRWKGTLWGGDVRLRDPGGVPRLFRSPIKSGMTRGSRLSWDDVGRDESPLVCNIFILHYLCPYERNILWRKRIETSWKPWNN